MQNETMSRDEIEERVANALVQALGVSRAEVTPEASLAGDLEAESIDFLDLVFRLEKDFGIEIARGELFPQELLRDPALVSNGRLTAEGVTEIRRRFPFTDLTALQAGAPVDELMNDLLTVNLIIDFVESKLRASAAAARAQTQTQTQTPYLNQ
jgi:acyl carrier protein